MTIIKIVIILHNFIAIMQYFEWILVVRCPLFGIRVFYRKRKKSIL